MGPVNAVVPGLGLHVWWYGLWMERAEGLSLNQLAYLGRKDLVEKMILNLMQVCTCCVRVLCARAHVDVYVCLGCGWNVRRG